MSNDSRRFYSSRIIDGLDAQIRACQQNSERNILFAQKAFALARHSQIEDSKNLIKELRSVNQNYEPRLSAWIMFAEGIIEHAYSYDLSKSRDRILRAHLVGQAANDPSLAATAAAWLADLDYLQGRYVDSSEFLEKAFAWSKESDSEARSRGSMVIGSALFFCGELSQGKYWLQLARSHAVKSGDIAMQNIILFNSSALDVARLTLIDCTGKVDAAELNFAAMSAQSVKNLNTALGNSNQPSMIPIQRAELLTIQQEWEEAIKIFDSHIDALETEGQSNWAPRHTAQRAWCKANVGDHLGSQLDAEKAMARTGSASDPDDLCVLHLRLAGAAEKMGKTHQAQTHQELGLQQLRLHRQHQGVVRELFGKIAKKSDPKQKTPA